MNKQEGKQFFKQRKQDHSLNKAVRTKEIHRIMHDNEAMLKRLQQRQSTYNVMSWENERKQQVKLIKQICHYKPTMLKRGGVKRGYKNRKVTSDGDKKDM